MTQITNALHDAKRLRLLACALELLQHERIDSAVIAIPATEPPRFVAIGTAATIAKLLEIDVPAAAAPDVATPEQAVHYTAKISEYGGYELCADGEVIGKIPRFDNTLLVLNALRAAQPVKGGAPAGYVAAEQIAAGATVKCDHGQPIGRNVAIDVFDAMRPVGKGGT